MLFLFKTFRHLRSFLRKRYYLINLYLRLCILRDHPNTWSWQIDFFIPWNPMISIKSLYFIDNYCSWVKWSKRYALAFTFEENWLIKRRAIVFFIIIKRNLMVIVTYGPKFHMTYIAISLYSLPRHWKCWWKVRKFTFNSPAICSILLRNHSWNSFLCIWNYTSTIYLGIAACNSAINFSIVIILINFRAYCIAYFSVRVFVSFCNIRRNFFSTFNSLLIEWIRSFLIFKRNQFCIVKWIKIAWMTKTIWKL
jgi:hypothetical protein